jgi:hypothetical protein
MTSSNPCAAYLKSLMLACVLAPSQQISRRTWNGWTRLYPCVTYCNPTTAKSGRCNPSRLFDSGCWSGCSGFRSRVAS